MSQVEIIGLTPELDSFVSPISSVVINMVKRDLQNLVTPILKTLLTDVVRDNAPSDLSVLFGWSCIGMIYRAFYLINSFYFHNKRRLFCQFIIAFSSATSMKNASLEFHGTFYKVLVICSAFDLAFFLHIPRHINLQVCVQNLNFFSLIEDRQNK